MSTALSVDSPFRNGLLAALPEADWTRMRPHLTPVAMQLGGVIYESGAQLDYVYFPTTSIVSLLSVMANGASAEIAVVGNDGVVGVALFMGGETTPGRAVVQSAGSAFRMPSRVVKEEFARGGELQLLLLRYTQVLITQMAQTAVCNRHHSIHQQLCRWLLVSLDRLSSPELTMTQGLIANMLGVRREGVTGAAGTLQAQGLISYARGRIKVIDRAGLEAQCCECYAVVKRESDRLLPLARHMSETGQRWAAPAAPGFAVARSQRSELSHRPPAAESSSPQAERGSIPLASVRIPPDSSRAIGEFVALRVSAKVEQRASAPFPAVGGAEANGIAR